MPQDDRLRESASQTAGPYVHIGLTPNANGIERVYPRDLGSAPAGEGSNRVKLDIRVFDGAGDAVRDILVELWHADETGRYPQPSEAPAPTGDPAGWARGVCAQGDDTVRFSIVKPGSAIAGTAPHVNVWLAARGINLALNTRIYFPDEDNAADPVLNRVDEARRATLIAQPMDGGYTIDIHLQGENETVFFDL